MPINISGVVKVKHIYAKKYLTGLIPLDALSCQEDSLPRGLAALIMGDLNPALITADLNPALIMADLNPALIMADLKYALIMANLK